MFFSLISKRIEDHILVLKKITNVSIQKVSITKVPGCLERMSLVWDGIKTEKFDQSDIVAAWLLIAHAY